MDEDFGHGMHHHRHGDHCWYGMHGEWHGYRRHFFTKAEKIERLKMYAEELKNELKAVEEKIKELQSPK